MKLLRCSDLSRLYRDNFGRPKGAILVSRKEQFWQIKGDDFGKGTILASRAFFARVPFLARFDPRPPTQPIQIGYDNY